MKTTLKRVLSIALALVLLIGALPLHAFAEENAMTYDWPNPDGKPHWKPDSSHVCYDEDGDCECDFSLGKGEKKWECSETVHTMIDVEAKAATCTEPGYSAHKACKNCGHAEGKTDYPASHSLTDVEGKAATCTEDGYTAYKACQCGYIEGKETIPASHDFGDNEAVCKVCGKPNPDYVAPEVKPAALIIRENGNKKHNTTGTPNSNVSIAECLKCAGINGDHVKEIWIDDELVNLTVNDSFVLGASETTTINFVTKVPVNNDKNDDDDVDNDTQYTVYYNLNVDESRTRRLGSFPAGTSLSTILNQSAIKHAQFPGLFQDWFAVEGWYLNGVKVTGNEKLTDDIVLYAKWYQKYNYEVILKLYTNGNTNTVVKVIDAFDYVQDDGKLSHTEVTRIAKEYIEPNNDVGLTVYGPFDAYGWEQYSIYNNRLTNTEYIEVNPYGTTVVHAMVHNAKIYNSNSSSSKADSSNPKTGDTIMVPAAIMSVSVSALAVMFYLKKKRAY